MLAQEAIVSKDSLKRLTSQAYKYSEEYDVKNAIDASNAIISIAQRQNDFYYSYLGHSVLGLVHFEAKDTLQARLSYEKALAVAKESKADSIISWAYVNLGNLESQSRVNYLKGINYFKESISINNRLNREKDNLVPNLNISWTFIEQNEIDKAYPFLVKTNTLVEKYAKKNYRLKTSAGVMFGRYYLAKGDFEKAEEHIYQAALLADKHNYVSRRALLYGLYSQLEEKRGNLNQALVYLKKSKEYESKMFEKEKIQAIESAKANLQIEQYKHTIADAKREQGIAAKLVSKSKLLNYILVVATLILLAAFIGIYLAFKSRNQFILRLHKKNRQLEEAKLKAEKLSKLKTQFFSTISHELRTPLYGVIGISSLLLDENTNPKMQDDLKSLKFSADYLLSLINDVLLMNKMDADGVKLQRIPFRLSDLTQNITRSFEFSLEQNNNTIHLNVDPKIPNNLLGDPVRLSQILMNLIGNAIKFNENGNIWVNIELIQMLSVHNYIVEFKIIDDGIGIPQSKQDLIFDEFSQVEDKKYNYQGTGLGLPIVKNLLDLFGSEISLKSTLGEGSTFSFNLELESNSYLDLKKTQETENEIGSLLSETNDKTIINPTILIVDDNRINQKITEKILGKHGYNCETAYDGLKAIALAQEKNYDLILMDIHMPKLDGIEATKTIRTFDTRTPIIALTAVEIDEMRIQIFESGMNDIILKPYDSAQFLSTILRNLNAPVANKNEAITNLRS